MTFKSRDWFRASGADAVAGHGHGHLGVDEVGSCLVVTRHNHQAVASMGRINCMGLFELRDDKFLILNKCSPFSG
jgi:hypothetical protein